MKFQEVTGVSQGLDGVKFFAMTLDEVLYEYTHSSYKPRVMTCAGLSAEAISIIDQVDAGAINRVRLEPVLEELNSALVSDSVAKSIVDFEPSYYTGFHKDCKLADLRTRLGLLGNRVGGYDYIHAIQGKLIELCEGGARKEDIFEIARLWVSVLCSAGYTKKYLQSIVREMFFGGGRFSFFPAQISRDFSMNLCWKIRSLKSPF